MGYWVQFLVTKSPNPIASKQNTSPNTGIKQTCSIGSMSVTPLLRERATRLVRVHVIWHVIQHHRVVAEVASANVIHAYTLSIGVALP